MVGWIGRVSTGKHLVEGGEGILVGFENDVERGL